MASSVLYFSLDNSLILIDIPRSIEIAQGESSDTGCRIISSLPLEKPFPSVEPKSAKARARLPQASIKELLLQRHVQIALDEVQSKKYEGKWCFPRVTTETHSLKKFKKRLPQEVVSARECILIRNPSLLSTLTAVEGLGHCARLPPKSTALVGDIITTVETFKQSAPLFDLVIMDPPWPNRSARRKSSYETSYSPTDIHTLLSSIPISSHLAENGLVGVWVTNKPAFRDLLLQDLGLFDEWGIQFVEEWVWVKITNQGETICALDSVWRKPYEILLLGRKKCSVIVREDEIKRRIVFGVPDFHSRKPNLKEVFEKVMKMEQYEGLEIFARNMTASWWSWGNEVLKFQTDEHWINKTQVSPSSAQGWGLDICT
ncbi:MT-A70-domain-containing protein [Tricladium varicosporioides]|nr:MT-A70-domain-containing protein [Hymenoscyphus varicosporioides]